MLQTNMRAVMNFLYLIFILFLNISLANSSEVDECKWKSTGKPCLLISKTNNTSVISRSGVEKTIITKQDIEKSGFSNLSDILKHQSGLNVFQNGNPGQSSSVFLRGGESNYTLVLLNGIAINDQSVTDGMHDFGQDFIQTLQQIEIYKGSNGVHFGPSAVSGAINLITDINYQNNLTFDGFNAHNNSGQANYTKITDNGWHLNLNGALNQSNLGSATADGVESDGSFNKQVNLNAEKFIADNLKLKSSFYVRETETAYDDMSNNGEDGYSMDNTMQAFQLGFERLEKDFVDDLKFHWQAYAKQIDDGGLTDSYDSQALVARYERGYNKFEKLSFGLGSEYKYDWGRFENRGSFNSSSKGHVKDFAFFGNAGFKINENTIFSLYGRADNHNTAGDHQTYKASVERKLDQISLKASHSTGLRNPTLYELFGSNNFGYKGDLTLDSEKSENNELSVSYDFFKNFNLKSTAYRTTVRDRLESNASFTAVENKKYALSHEGLENKLTYNDLNQKITFFTDFSKSENETGINLNRRPDFNLGFYMSKKLESSNYGPYDLNLYYKHTGKYRDFDGGNVYAKSTDIVDAAITKNIWGMKFNVSITNLLNERYEKPRTYSQDGRQIRFGVNKLY